MDCTYKTYCDCIFFHYTVKPRAPVNVTIEHNGEIAKVHWDSGYTWENYLFQKLKYDVQITSKQHPTEVIFFDPW